VYQCARLFHRGDERLGWPTPCAWRKLYSVFPTPDDAGGRRPYTRGWLRTCGSIEEKCGLVERERQEMLYAKSRGIAVVILLLVGSQWASAMAQPGLQERKGSPACLSAVTQTNANPPQESSTLRVAAWLQVAQANSCSCPAVTCSELQRSAACQVSCARGRSAYCQCGSCTGISLSSANYCACR
jgi:hypothetical protein